VTWWDVVVDLDVGEALRLAVRIAGTTLVLSVKLAPAFRVVLRQFNYQRPIIAQAQLAWNDAHGDLVAALFVDAVPPHRDRRAVI